MIWRQIDTCTTHNPIPISFLIHVASTFDCDISVKCEDRQVNVKSYEELKNHLRMRDPKLLFFFNGADEQAAEQKIERIFQRQ